MIDMEGMPELKIESKINIDLPSSYEKIKKFNYCHINLRRSFVTGAYT